MRRFVAASVFVTLMTIAPQSSHAEVGPVQMPGTDHWYEVVYAPGTWQDALEAAMRKSFRGLQGHLATITSAAENDFITSLDETTRLWLGARDIGQTDRTAKRTWVWVTGPESGTVFATCSETQARDNCTTTQGGFSNWDRNEPNNYWGNEWFLVTNWDNPGKWNDCFAPNCAAVNGYGYVIEYEAWTPPTPPDAPKSVFVSASDSSATVSWTPAASDSKTSASTYTASATPGGQSCTTVEKSCVITGLTNRVRYSISVTAANQYGTSIASTPTLDVVPLSAGFQAWPSNPVLPIGGTSLVNVGNGPAMAPISVFGLATSTLMTDSAGLAVSEFVAERAGASRLTFSFSTKNGKRLSRYTASTRIFVPAVLAPTIKIKQGKTGKFSLQFMPPGAAVAIALSDGRTLTGTADSAGKATFAPTFNTLGAVTYTASVAGVQVGSGGLTVTK